MKLFVGNLSFSMTENELENLFAQYGTVNEVGVVTDRMSGQSRGFAFVTMNGKTEAEAAIQALNGKQIEGRALTVNEARPKTDRPARSFGRASR